ncbi:MAG: protein kinase [Myxococcales bacterium]|nr:protein kinase [Myxococcales bacterium]
MSDDGRAHDAGQVADTGPRPADPMVGTVLKGTYQVLRRVAEGGMGVVYEGEHVRLKRRVAIKVLLSQYARHPEVLARFRREAEIVGGLGHPHIVQVFDVDETDTKDPFLVMEYLEGETLAERLEREPRLPLAAALRVATQVASALTSTHLKEIVHRDLKPENVFLVKATGEKEFVKVLDFGISKVRGGGPRLTAQNMVIGTPAYMAPEQARGERDVDHRVDQFALSAITYEMLTGQLPFPGEDPVEIMKGVIGADPIPLRKIASWIPEAVENVVLRGLSKKPADRFSTIAEFAAALDRAVTSATATSASERRTVAAPISEAPDPPDAASAPNAASSRSAASSPPKSAEKIGPAGTYSARPSQSVEKIPTSVARNEKPTPPAQSRQLEPARPQRAPSISMIPSKGPLLDEGRMPTAPAPENLVDRVGPVSRRPVTPGPRAGSSEPPAPESRRGRDGQLRLDVPPSVPPYERISRVPSSPPSSPPPESRERALTPAGSGARNAVRAQRALEEARAALKLGRLDEAVEHAEKLLELAVFGKETGVYEVLRAGMPVVDHIFEARVGPLDRTLEITAAARDQKKMNLSSKAAFVLACAEGGVTIQEAIDVSGIPRRDVIRMLAGLMRRGALVPH